MPRRRLQEHGAARDPGAHGNLRSGSGVPGPSGVPGVVQVIPVDGLTTTTLTNSFIFLTTPSTVTVTSGQRITANITSTMGTIDPGSVQYVGVTMRTKPDVGGGPTPVHDIGLPRHRDRQSGVADTFTAPGPGTILVGACALTAEPSASIEACATMGWLMVT